MTGWELLRPPTVDEELGRWTLKAAGDLQPLRAALREVVMSVAAAMTDRHDLVERLTIVATELAGNALRHGRPPLWWPWPAATAP
ncbi:hypothetical protein [Actinoplanes sp. GCM10030250]|uniref:hypothetical protein n=1 Tax=Actinoplanes sp. GCM10030250 TaxID=3273376 RepID=UPI0036089645